jgi:PleD family two-component response regulator
MKKTSKELHRIMIVDDDADIIQYIKAVLDEYYEVYAFENGQDAVDYFVEIEPDLVILDAMMPVISGYEIAEVIRANPAYRDIPIFMLSVLDSMKDHEAGYIHGITLYLTKPIEPDILKQNIELELLKLGGPYPKKVSSTELQNKINLNS